MSLRLTLLRAPLRSASPLRSSFAAPISVRRISQYQRLYSSTPDEKDKDGADGAKKKRPPPPPRAPLEPTTFDGKASPRDVHNRPVRLRGMPPTMAAWEVERSHSRPRSNAAGPRPAPRPKLEEHIFNESAAPRAIYKRPTRELPLANVSSENSLDAGWRWRRGGLRCPACVAPASRVVGSRNATM